MCRERLSGFKVPDEVYEHDAVPRTPSGKTDRPALARELTERLTTAREDAASALRERLRALSPSGRRDAVLRLAAPARAGGVRCAGAGHGTRQALPDAGLTSLQGVRAPFLDAERDLLEMRHPGIGEGDSVPQDWDGLVDLHADTVSQRLGGRPYAVLGHSVGGCPAHSVAARLTADGKPPTGLILVDTYHVTPDREDEPWLLALPARVPLRMGERFDSAVDDMSVAALGAYTRMSCGWHPEPTDVPTLLVPPRRSHAGNAGRRRARRTR